MFTLTDGQVEPLLTFRVVLLGWCIRNTGATTVDLDVLDADADSGHPAFPLSIPSGASDRMWLGDSGVTMRTGVTLKASGGGVVGSILYDAGRL